MKSFKANKREEVEGTRQQPIEGQTSQTPNKNSESVLQQIILEKQILFKKIQPFSSEQLDSQQEKNEENNSEEYDPQRSELAYPPKIDMNHGQFDTNNVISTAGMTSQEILNIKLDKTKFQWLPCNFFIRQQLKERTIVWSMNPTITFGNPKSDAPNPRINMKIWMDRPFIYDAQLGWNWHKSWILPSICVKLEIIDEASSEVFQPPSNTYAKVYAVKAFTKDIQNFHLIDIGLKGNDKISLESNGTAQFFALKFSSTSYNNDAIIIDDQTSIHPKIVDAKISPPVFVDSRKSARETQTIKDIKQNSFFELFQPDILDKCLVKRKKKDSESVQEEIKNDLMGFINYFTAPNIRNKVKHPLYLATKFSNCITLYYNKQVYKGLNSQQVIIQIMEDLQDKMPKIEKNQKVDSFMTKFNPNTYLIISIHAQSENQQFITKKINELVGQMDNKYLNILFQGQEFGENFLALDNINQIKEIYKFNYTKVIEKRNKKNNNPLSKCRETKLITNNTNSTNFTQNNDVSLNSQESQTQKKICTNKEKDQINITKSYQQSHSEEEKSQNLQKPSSESQQSQANITPQNFNNNQLKYNSSNSKPKPPPTFDPNLVSEFQIHPQKRNSDTPIQMVLGNQSNMLSFGGGIPGMFPQQQMFQQGLGGMNNIQGQNSNFAQITMMNMLMQQQQQQYLLQQQNDMLRQQNLMNQQNKNQSNMMRNINPKTEEN